MCSSDLNAKETNTNNKKPIKYAKKTNTNENQLKHRWNKEKTIITYKSHNGQDLPLPRYYKTAIYTDDQRQLLWLYAEDKGVKWVKGFEVIEANTVNKDYYERLLKEKNENGIGLHNDNIEEIERKKAINQMTKLQNLTDNWKYGITFTGYFVNEKTINYITRDLLS